jgi:transmembrane sensor
VQNMFDWMILDRYLADDMRPGDLELLEGWLAGHPSRTSLLQALIAERTGRQGDSPTWDIDALANRIADRTSPMPLESRSQRRAAASRLFRNPPSKSRERSWANAAQIAAAVAIVGTASFVAAHQWSHRAPRAVPAPKMREFATTRGQIASIYLADGSRVVLAPESRLRVLEAFAERIRPTSAPVAREVKLDGAAYFDVVHDANRPFSVATSVGVALDLGTEFEVRAYESAEPARPMQVTVISGVVSLHRPAPGAQPVATLRRGDRGVLSGTGKFTLAQNVDLGPSLAWTKGSLVFNHARVSEVVRELSRWYDLDIRLSAGVNPNRELVLTLDNEAARDAINLVALSLGLRVQGQGRIVTLYPQ